MPWRNTPSPPSLGLATEVAAVTAAAGLALLSLFCATNATGLLVGKGEGSGVGSLVGNLV